MVGPTERIPFKPLFNRLEMVLPMEDITIPLIPAKDDANRVPLLNSDLFSVLDLVLR